MFLTLKLTFAGVREFAHGDNRVDGIDFLYMSDGESFWGLRGRSSLCSIGLDLGGKRFSFSSFTEGIRNPDAEAQQKDRCASAATDNDVTALVASMSSGKGRRIGGIYGRDPFRKFAPKFDLRDRENRSLVISDEIPESPN